VFQVQLHLQRLTANRLDGGDLRRLHPQLGVRRDPHSSISLLAFGRERPEVGTAHGFEGPRPRQIFGPLIIFIANNSTTIEKYTSSTVIV
jgi:hypothetical protein